MSDAAEEAAANVPQVVTMPPGVTAAGAGAVDASGAAQQMGAMNGMGGVGGMGGMNGMMLNPMQMMAPIPVSHAPALPLLLLFIFSLPSWPPSLPPLRLRGALGGCCVNGARPSPIYAARHACLPTLSCAGGEGAPTGDS